AQIVEHRAPHAEQAERVPVRVDASLDVEQQAAVAGLVAARISAQAGVASQGQLAGSGGVLEGVAGERDERQGPAGRVAVESNRAAYPLPVEGRVAGRPGDRGGAQQEPAPRKPKAVARAGGVEPEILRRAKAGQRAAELNAGLGSHREVLGTLDQIPVLDLLVVVLRKLVAEKGRDERLIGRKRIRRWEKIRFGPVGILLVAEAGGIPMRPPVHQARGPAAERFRAVLAVAKLGRSEEHTSELQSPYDLVCRLLLEKKKKKKQKNTHHKTQTTQ